MPTKKMKGNDKWKEMINDNSNSIKRIKKLGRNSGSWLLRVGSFPLAFLQAVQSLLRAKHENNKKFQIKSRENINSEILGTPKKHKASQILKY